MIFRKTPPSAFGGAAGVFLGGAPFGALRYKMRPSFTFPAGSSSLVGEKAKSAVFAFSRIIFRDPFDCAARLCLRRSAQGDKTGRVAYAARNRKGALSLPVILSERSEPKDLSSAWEM